MRCDFHTHSNFSFDGDPAATIDAMCESAIAKGLTHYAITDHCDINGEIEGIYAILDKDGMRKAVEAAKAKYAGRLTVLYGIELGEATQYPRESEALLDAYPFDIVLGSLHNLAGEKDFCEFDYTGMTDAEARRYFDRVLGETSDLVDFGRIHVLTHLTYLHRYLKKNGLDLDFKPFYPRLRALFEKIAARNLALEVNTSTLGNGMTMPPASLLTLYRECGGTRLSVGSDAHSPAHVAQHFGTAAEIISTCGFDTLRVPTAHGELTFKVKETD